MKTSSFSSKQFAYDNADEASYAMQYNRWNRNRKIAKGINPEKKRVSDWQGMTSERCAY